MISYYPGYQRVMKELKHSTRQRFLAIEFNYPAVEIERSIIMKETGLDRGMADRLVRLGGIIRNLRQHGLEEGISTRLLVYAGMLIADCLLPATACSVAVTRAMSDDVEMQDAIAEIVSGIF